MLFYVIICNFIYLIGVVKVTPAHDPNDFACGERHNLPEKIVIDSNCKICGDVDPIFLGLDRFDARAAIVAAMTEKGLYVEKVS